MLIYTNIYTSVTNRNNYSRYFAIYLTKALGTFETKPREQTSKTERERMNKFMQENEST